MPVKHVIVRYLGTVQGVGFRYTARAAAAAKQVTGFVRNEPDGSVHLEAEGEKEVLIAFLGKIRSARRDYIDRVEEAWGPATGAFESFEIRYW